MLSFVLLIMSLGLVAQYTAQSVSIHENDINFRVEAGATTCFFEQGKAGQTLDVYYQVVDGQHGDLDIVFEVTDPLRNTLVSDYKKSQNSIIIDLTLDGDYTFCLDNSYSMMNSKLVFISVVIEDKLKEGNQETEVSVVDGGEELNEVDVLEWTGVDENGEEYYLEVNKIADSLKHTLQQVLKARKLLEMYAAIKSRDSYLAFEDTFIVDVWSGFQISFMFIVGMLQVYMIKKLFSNKPKNTNNIYI